MTPVETHANIWLADSHPDINDLLDASIRDVFDMFGRFPEVEDHVRMVGIGYSSPTRRPSQHDSESLLEEVYRHARDYRVLILV